MYQKLAVPSLLMTISVTGLPRKPALPTTSPWAFILSMVGGSDVSVTSVWPGCGHKSPLSVRCDNLLSAGSKVTNWILSLLGLLLAHWLAL